MKTPEQLRLEAGLNVRQLADLAGVSMSTVSRIEKAQTVRLQAVPLQKIGNALRDRFLELGQKFETGKYIEVAIAMRDARLKSMKVATLEKGAA